MNIYQQEREEEAEIQELARQEHIAKMPPDELAALDAMDEEAQDFYFSQWQRNNELARYEDEAWEEHHNNSNFVGVF